MRKIKNALKPLYQKMYYSSKPKWDRFALKQMINCKKILDVGCGLGRFILNDPNRISGVDGSPSSVKECKKRGLNVKLGSVTKLPFENASFDGVNCSHVIEHLVPKEAYKRE